MTLPLPTSTPTPVYCRGRRASGRRCGLVLIREPWRSLGMGEDCAERAGLVPPRPGLRVAAGGVSLLDVLDPVVGSVAAYTSHADTYATRNFDRSAADAARFAALLPAGSRVLDAGCGPGRDMARFAEAGLRPVGVDLCATFLNSARRHGPVVHGDLRAIPLSDATVDGVWACASLVHLPPDDAAAALADLHRVAAPAAPLYASVKGAGVTGWRETEVGVRWFHVWTVAGFAAALDVAGWQVVQARRGGDFVDVWARKPASRSVMDAGQHKDT